MSDHDQDDVLEPAPADMGWLLTFADLVSLLITFFVLLYSMKVVDTQRWDELKGSFSGTFSVRKPVQDVKPDQNETIEKVDPIRADSLAYVEGVLRRNFAESTALQGARITRDHQRDTLTIAVPSVDLFDSASSKIQPTGFADLKRLGDVLRHLDNRIVVASHTNTAPIKTRRYPSNWELGMMRSVAVSEVLRAQGITKHITVRSYGDSRFDQVAPHLPMGKRMQLANRVEIVLHGEEEL